MAWYLIIEEPCPWTCPPLYIGPFDDKRSARKHKEGMRTGALAISSKVPILVRECEAPTGCLLVQVQQAARGCP